MPYKVYKYTFPDGKIYIGCTSLSIEKRRDNGYAHNKPLQAAIRKVGWRSIKKDIVADNLQKVDAFSLEEEMIRKLDATNPSIGYNISFGGTSTFAGLKHTDEYRKKMSDMYKGKTFSTDTLSRMKAAHEKERKSVDCFYKDGNLFKHFLSLRDAAVAFNTYPSTITRACTRRGVYKNFAWRFANERG